MAETLKTRLFIAIAMLIGVAYAECSAAPPPKFPYEKLGGNFYLIKNGVPTLQLKSQGIDPFEVSTKQVVPLIKRFQACAVQSNWECIMKMHDQKSVIPHLQHFAIKKIEKNNIHLVWLNLLKSHKNPAIPMMLLYRASERIDWRRGRWEVYPHSVASNGDNTIFSVFFFNTDGEILYVLPVIRKQKGGEFLTLDPYHFQLGSLDQDPESWPNNKAFKALL